VAPHAAANLRTAIEIIPVFGARDGRKAPGVVVMDPEG
jgi:hypothetical protein